MNRTVALALASLGCFDPGAYVRIYGPVEGDTLLTDQPAEVYGVFLGRGADAKVMVIAAPCGSDGAPCALDVATDEDGGTFTASYTPSVAGPAWVWASVVNTVESDADIVKLVVDDP